MKLKFNTHASHKREGQHFQTKFVEQEHPKVQR